MSHAFSIISIIQPPTKPASRPPKKPDGTAAATPASTAASPVKAPGLAKVAPLVARKPPTKPTNKPGLSAILIAMKPARIGTIRLNATPPIVFKKADAGVIVPKLPLPEPP